MLYDIHLRSLVEPFIPYYDETFFPEFSKMIHLVAAGDRDRLGQVRLIFATIFVQLMFFPCHAIMINKSPYRSVVTFDICGLTGLPFIVNYEGFLVMSFMTHLVYIILFVAIKNKAIIYFMEVFVEHDFRFVLTKNGSSLISHFSLVANILQKSIMMQNIFFIICYPTFLLPLLDYNLEPTNFLLDVMLFHISFLLFYSWLVFFSYFGLIAANVCFGCLFIFNARLESMSRLLHAAPNRLTLIRLLFCIRQHLHTLIFMLEWNKIYGVMLFSFLVTTCPLNATLLMFLLEGGGESAIMNCMLAGFLVPCMFVMIGLHSIAALYTDRLHTPYKRFISLSMKIRKPFSIQNRLYLAKNIQAFHVKRKYGITYGFFGLVSMPAFCKFLFLFSEGLFYNFKMVHHI